MKVPPTLLQPLTDVHVIEGGKAVFICQASGHPHPTVSWSGPSQHVIQNGGRIALSYSKDGSARLEVCRLIRFQFFINWLFYVNVTSRNRQNITESNLIANLSSFIGLKSYIWILTSGSKNALQKFYNLKCFSHPKCYFFFGMSPLFVGMWPSLFSIFFVCIFMSFAWNGF